MTPLATAHAPAKPSSSSGAPAATDTVDDMAKEVTLSLPDDVAAFLDRLGDASTFVADAVRGRMMGAVVRQQLLDNGFAITEEGIHKAGEEMERIHAAITPELRAEAAAVYAEVMRLRAGRSA